MAKSIRHQNPQLPQRLLSWSGHVTSWLNAPIPLHVMRYEDMLSDPIGAFSAAVRFCGLDFSGDRLARAVEQTSFEQLRRREERESRFREAPLAMQTFFRRGVAGDWVNHLTPGQAERIIRRHQDAMSGMGYLDRMGRPSF